MRPDAENLPIDPAYGYVPGTFFIEVTSIDRRPFIACGNLAHHDGLYWLKQYRARHPNTVFTLYREGAAD